MKNLAESMPQEGEEPNQEEGAVQMQTKGSFQGQNLLNKDIV